MALEAIFKPTKKWDMKRENIKITLILRSKERERKIVTKGAQERVSSLVVSVQSPH